MSTTPETSGLEIRTGKAKTLQQAHKHIRRTQRDNKVNRLPDHVTQAPDYPARGCHRDIDTCKSDHRNITHWHCCASPGALSRYTSYVTFFVCNVLPGWIRTGPAHAVIKKPLLDAANARMSVLRCLEISQSWTEYSSLSPPTITSKKPITRALGHRFLVTNFRRGAVSPGEAIL